VDYRAPSGATPLYLTIVQPGNVDHVGNLILRHRASLAPQPDFIPLHVAVGVGNVRVVEMMVSQTEVSA
jgi:hypothetical protein